MRTDLVSGCDLKVSGSRESRALNGWFNTACFQPVDTSTVVRFGNEPRNVSAVRMEPRVLGVSSEGFYLLLIVEGPNGPPGNWDSETGRLDFDREIHLVRKREDAGDALFAAAQPEVFAAEETNERITRFREHMLEFDRDLLSAVHARV